MTFKRHRLIREPPSFFHPNYSSPSTVIFPLTNKMCKKFLAVSQHYTGYMHGEIAEKRFVLPPAELIYRPMKTRPTHAPRRLFVLARCSFSVRIRILRCGESIILEHFTGTILTLVHPYALHHPDQSYLPLLHSNCCHNRVVYWFLQV